MSGTSNHHEIDWEFSRSDWSDIAFIKTDAVNLVQVVAEDIAISVGVVAPGSVWRVVEPFTVTGV